MVKSGAPPDKFGNMEFTKYGTVCLPIEFHGITSRINSKGYHSLISGLISVFRDVWVPLNALLYHSLRKHNLQNIGNNFHNK